MRRTHVVALSGGADSTALALMMAERGDHVDHYLCTPTGNELPAMQAHWDMLDVALGKPITRVEGPGLIATSRAQNMLPHPRMRWCTRLLKIEPCIAFLARFAAEGSPPVLYVGLRADEETRAGLYHDQIETRCPLREWGWTRADVLAYLDRLGVTIPTRTDCAGCHDQQLVEWWQLWRFHPGIFAELETLEQDISEHHGKVYSIRSPSRDTWPAPLAGLRAEFERKRIPTPAKLQLPLFGASVSEQGGKCRVCSL